MKEIKKIKNDSIKFLYEVSKRLCGEEIAENIKTKLKNVSNKTGKYNVPDELFQKRTKRNNRVLISWKDVYNNKLDLEKLKTFEGGVVVEFINDDYWSEFDDSDNMKNIFEELKTRLGSDKNVSAMISIRNEDGDSSSKKQREAFEKLKEEQKDWENKLIRRKNSNSKNKGMGNDKWEGFIYVSIKGGQQDTIESHKGRNELLFNPACEYASNDVMLDIDLVLIYFILKSIDTNKLNDEEKKEFDKLLNRIEKYLEKRIYNNTSYRGNLLDYCKNHPSLKFSDDRLFDPIQMEKIDLCDFGIKNGNRSIDLAHNEAVNKNKFYWDEKLKCVLSAARPTNVFWERHLSNMMQQDYTLDEFFEKQEEIVERRKGRR